MKKNMLLIIVILFLGCETGTRYDRNATIKTAPKNESQNSLVNRDDIEALLDDKEESRNPFDYERSYIESDEIVEEPEDLRSFSDADVKNGLDVNKIREGKHKEYIRLVFDVSDDGKPAKSVGRYDAKYHGSKKEISVVLHGYEEFSASLPSFPYYSIIEKIYFEKYPKNKGFKFHIKLRENAKVKIFALKSPARLVFDIKKI